MKNILIRLFKKVERKLYFMRNSKGVISYYKKYGLVIGDRCQLLQNTVIPEPFLVQIGNDVKITDNVKLLTHDGGIHVLRNMRLLPKADKFGKIKIGNNVFIGNNVIILPDVEIGNNVVVGAGSVVTKNISDNVIIAGVPAKVIKSTNDYYESIKSDCVFTKDLNPKDRETVIRQKFEI